MERAVILKNVAAVKLMPDSDSELADEVLHGMVVDIVEKQDAPWYKIRTMYDYYGYVHSGDMLIDNSKAFRWQDENYAICGLIVDVMSEPKYGSSIAATLVRGCLVKQTGMYEDKWEKIELADGSTGWIRSGFARRIVKLQGDVIETEQRENIVNTALDYLGTQYRWGGKSHFGIDCSGLASMAYMMNGFMIPRDGGPQQEYLRPISREEAKPGDLVFFPGHVAIYLGNGRYVHSTGREGYTLVNSFNKGDKDYREDLDKKVTGYGTIFGTGTCGIKEDNRVSLKRNISKAIHSCMHWMRKEAFQ